jgi:predicted nucleic acid-binding protein
MTVVDASVVVEYLVGGPGAPAATGRLDGEPFDLWAPHLIDAEVGHALRGKAARGEISTRTAKRALGEFRELPLRREGHEALLDVAWDLRNNVSFYDALYVALASLAGQPLITFDARLASVRGLPAEIELLAA